MNLRGKKWLVTIIILFFLVLFGLLFYFNSFNSPFERDEGEYGYAAWIMKEGSAPYENSFLLKPPMIIYTYLLGLLINSDALWPPRAIAFVFTLLTAVMAGLIAKREYGTQAGIIASFLFIPMNALPFLASFAANTERFMQLPMVAVLALYVFYKDSRRFWIWFLAGFLASIAIFYKQIALLPLVFIFLAWTARALNLKPVWARFKKYLVQKVLLIPQENVRKENQETFSFKKSFQILLRIFIPTGAGILLAVSVCFGYFIFSGKMPYVWECVVKYSGLYAGQTSLSFGNFIRYGKLFLSFWWPFLIFLALFILMKKPRTGFYLTLVLISLFSVIFSIGHYYLLLIPYLAILGSGSISGIGELIFTRLKFTPKGKKISVFFLASLIILFMVSQVGEQFSKTPKELSAWVYAGDGPFQEAVEVAQKVKEKTKSTDQVFVSGAEPEILFYAKRRSPSRFIIINPLSINTPKSVDYQKETINSLKSNLPKIIVVDPLISQGWPKGTASLYFDFINTILDEHYQLVGGYERSKGKDGNWEEPLEKENMPYATLLVYERAH